MEDIVAIPIKTLTDLYRRADETSPFRLKFKYSSIVREVENPIIEQGVFDTLLSGLEVTKGGKSSNQFKHYLLKNVRPV